MHENCKNSVSKKSIWVLSWIFQRRLKGEYHLTKRHYVHTTANTTVTVVFTATNIFIYTTCKAKSTERKIRQHIGYQKEISTITLQRLIVLS